MGCAILVREWRAYHKKTNMLKTFITLLSVCLSGLFAMAQMPTASPTATIIAPEDNAGELGSEEYQAPLTVRFEANDQPEGWTALYEWRITRQGQTQPLVVRNDASLDYAFNKSGAWEIDLFVTFVSGGDTIVYDREPDRDSDTEHITRMGPLMETPFSVSISESNLEFPNAFSPNGDGINDYLNAKQANSKSIVEFEASVYNRWGKQLYSWTDWRNKESGWDGTDHGRRCADGAYYLVVKARGADGRKYNIRKTISVLTGFNEEEK